MWRDEIKQAAVRHRSTRRKVSKNDYVAFAPFAPFCILTVQRPRRPLIEYLAGNVAFVS